jgi:hypothetical protein
MDVKVRSQIPDREHGDAFVLFHLKKISPWVTVDLSFPGLASDTLYLENSQSLSLKTPPDFGIQRLPNAIANKVETEDGDENGCPRER